MRKMKIPETVAEARKIQKKLLAESSFENRAKRVDTICGCDVSYLRRKNVVKAACSVFEYPALNEVERAVHKENPGKLFPYVPGYLSFREIPFLLKAIKKIKSTVDIFMVDGHGMAHPRRIGLAVHLGIMLKKPTIGCAKKRLFGIEEKVGEEKGDYSYIKDSKCKIIGAKVRTRKNVKPVYVSPGWGLDLKSSIEIVLKTAPKYRQPEMLRSAHKLTQSA